MVTPLLYRLRQLRPDENGVCFQNVKVGVKIRFNYNHQARTVKFKAQRPMAIKGGKSERGKGIREASPWSVTSARFHFLWAAASSRA
jgi:hypothetical protein